MAAVESSPPKTPMGLPSFQNKEPDSVIRAIDVLTDSQPLHGKLRLLFGKRTFAFNMASSEVDQKFLGKLAKEVEKDNHLLSEMLFKILGLSLNLAEQLVAAKKQRRQTTVTSPDYLKRVWHILWLSREGLKMLEQYVMPMVGSWKELQVLTYKLRASFYHIFVLFYNNPVVSDLSISEAVIAHPSNRPRRGTRSRGKGIACDADVDSINSSVQPTHALEEGKIPPPGFSLVSADTIEFSPHFLISSTDYLPTAQKCFNEAIRLADEYLWGSHSLRLSVKTEYAAFLYECVRDQEGSRKLAKDTIAEVYEAQEGMDDEMFSDACQLVTVLGKMMKRGLSTRGRNRGAASPTAAVPLPGMVNPI